MSTSKSIVATVFFALCTVLSLHAESAGLKSSAANSSTAHAYAPHVLNVAPKVKARILALARYQFLKRLEPHFGYLPLYGTGEERCYALFPIGRSDRVYLFFCYTSWPDAGGAPSMIFRYDHKGSKDELVYRINLVATDKPRRKFARLNSLLDYLGSTFYPSVTDGHRETHEVLPRDVSKFAINDLAAKREYVKYEYVGVTNELIVGLLSDSVNYKNSEFVDLDYPKDYYKVYGLPAAKKERSLVQ